MSAELAVDWTRCDGHGLCHLLLPDRIGVDEWGFPLVRHPRLADRDEEAAARRAVAACPSLALRIETHPDR